MYARLPTTATSLETAPALDLADYCWFIARSDIDHHNTDIVTGEQGMISGQRYLVVEASGDLDRACQCRVTWLGDVDNSQTEGDVGDVCEIPVQCHVPGPHVFHRRIAEEPRAGRCGRVADVDDMKPARARNIGVVAGDR